MDRELARQQLELAQQTSKRLWDEYFAYLRTPEPDRDPAWPGGPARWAEASEWTRKMYEAEQELLKPENAPGIIGTLGDYQWLTMVDCDITELLRLCPDVVLNKFLAVTGFEARTLDPAEMEKLDGWRNVEIAKVFHCMPWAERQDTAEREYRDDWKVAYSPRLDSIHGLPNEMRTEDDWVFDEWYVFEQSAPVGEMEVFVNHGGFRLYDPRYKQCADRLGEQLVRFAPESYIADGTVFTFATPNADLFHKVLEALSANTE